MSLKEIKRDNTTNKKAEKTKISFNKIWNIYPKIV